ncbi:hypothetical protein BCR34DRAFT_674184 [Clohesyomyces aquaticus]|uniref:C2H2-type domain-containing protein n=1 Tax=Clohesyomyces aquaticus TaxID=1231657 RepID=A0A1Y1ZK60_9PLEO|nr:hypothetical protein BCR34DRAFT_674184 [Clohesyomyces aquaticus]
MVDSDYEFDEDASDDEYIEGHASSSTRAHAHAPAAAGKRRAQEKPRKPLAWERDSSKTVITSTTIIQEAEDGTIQQSVQEREEERKRKRLRKDTKPFQRGIIRHVTLVLDLSEAMLEKDMRPNRYITMIKYTQEYVREFFEQNPISQMSVLGMHDGIYHQSLCARPYSNESEYVVATDQELLRELLLATTTPPVIRSNQPATAAQSESAAALMMMGFPSRVVEDAPTMCACHGILTRGGYTCSRCKAKVCSLPVTCPSCQLTLLLSTHLARSYHHLFPLRNWIEVSWARARELGTRECVGCQSALPIPPEESADDKEKERLDAEKPRGKVEKAAAQRRMDEDDLEEQRASESSRYECRACESHFCVDCDTFCHMVLHNCPGCLSKRPPPQETQDNGDIWYSTIIMPFERLIRFVAGDDKTYYGNLTKETPTREIQGSEVDLLSGDVKTGFSKTGERATVSKLLCPLPSTNIVMCIGLNYRHHAEEAKLSIPKYPTVFTKPPDALTGPIDAVPIHPDCQNMLDYEGELTIVIGRDCKNVKASDAYSYILGYTVGNDVSARNFQLPADVSGGQFGYAKSFDGFAPIGPAIVSTSVIPDPQKLKYWTKVNGETRQQTGTDDMIWSVQQIVEHLSRGTTLRAGTVIMTGTPSGVGIFMEPKGFVKDGDEVEIYVEGIGSLVNKMKFE